jgi:hypothetical protein
MKSVYRYVGLMVGLMFLSFNSVADVSFDTAASSVGGGGLVVSDNFWQFHRFSVSSTDTLENVGGVFRNCSGSSLDVFAAVVKLTHSLDFPDSANLTTPDLVATTLISIAPSSCGPGEAFEGSINLVLTSGLYALGFGTGAFGASNAIGNSLVMPSHENDLTGGVPFSAFHSTNSFSHQGVALRFFASAATVPSLSCVGFESPMDGGAVKVKKNRALPHKAQLLDEMGSPLNDLDIAAAPVIQVIFDDGVLPAEDVSGDALSAGAGTDGNQFEFLDSKWQFNLKTKNYTGAGTYTTTMVSADTSEYVIDDPSCTGVFVIK